MMHNLHTSLPSGSIAPHNLATAKTYTIFAPETKTTDPIERRIAIKKMSDLKEIDKCLMETLASSPPKIHI